MSLTKFSWQLSTIIFAMAGWGLPIATLGSVAPIMRKKASTNLGLVSLSGGATNAQRTSLSCLSANTNGITQVLHTLHAGPKSVQTITRTRLCYGSTKLQRVLHGGKLPMLVVGINPNGFI